MKFNKPGNDIWMILENEEIDIAQTGFLHLKTLFIPTDSESIPVQFYQKASEGEIAKLSA